MSKKCINCGVELFDEDLFCGDCGTKQISQLESPQKEKSFTVPHQAIINEENISITETKIQEDENIKKFKKTVKKNKVTAGILAILLGWCGAHWFYLNKPIRAVIYVVLYIVFPFAWLGYVVEGIYFLSCKTERFEKYIGVNRKIW